MSQRINNLNEIIAVLEAGAGYYRDAASRLNDADLVETFKEHAQLRDKVSGELRRLVDRLGGEPTSASMVETARGLYGKLMAAIGDTRERLIASLEEHEDRTLEAFRKAIAHEDNAEDETMLRDHLEQFRSIHDRMKALKDAA